MIFETRGTGRTSGNTSSCAKGSEGNVLYLCDGKAEDCSKAWCFTSQGPCMHTRDVRHARNFSVIENDGGLNAYMEEPSGKEHHVGFGKSPV